VQSDCVNSRDGISCYIHTIRYFGIEAIVVEHRQRTFRGKYDTGVGEFGTKELSFTQVVGKGHILYPEERPVFDEEGAHPLIPSFSQSRRRGVFVGSTFPMPTIDGEVSVHIPIRGPDDLSAL